MMKPMGCKAHPVDTATKAVLDKLAKEISKLFPYITIFGCTPRYTVGDILWLATNEKKVLENMGPETDEYGHWLRRIQDAPEGKVY
jgi:hypothetical protein